MSNNAKRGEERKPPSRLLLDAVFWAGHISIAVYLIYEIGDSKNLKVLSYASYPAFICFFLYPFAIGSFANKIGKRGFWWGLSSFLFSPLAIWITYILSYTKTK